MAHTIDRLTTRLDRTLNSQSWLSFIGTGLRPGYAVKVIASVGANDYEWEGNLVGGPGLFANVRLRCTVALTKSTPDAVAADDEEKTTSGDLTDIDITVTDTGGADAELTVEGVLLYP
jgi:hypothetical protein